MLGDAEVMEFFEKRFSRAESEVWLRRQQGRYERDGYGFWLAVDLRTGEPVGQAGLARVAIGGVDEPALGYLIHRPPENGPSQCVARKLGMMPVGIVLYGGFEHLLYTLTRADRDARTGGRC
jgi:RimJ/RimL family protein N-acetyltransferase